MSEPSYHQCVVMSSRSSTEACENLSAVDSMRDSHARRAAEHAASSCHARKGRGGSKPPRNHFFSGSARSKQLSTGAVDIGTVTVMAMPACLLGSASAATWAARRSKQRFCCAVQSPHCALLAPRGPALLARAPSTAYLRGHTPVDRPPWTDLCAHYKLFHTDDSSAETPVDRPQWTDPCGQTRGQTSVDRPLWTDTCAHFK